MPGPFDLLKQVWRGANTPLVPQEWTDQAADMIDSPSLDRGVNRATLEGFGAGALQGAQTLTTPLNIAGMLVPALKGLRGKPPTPMGPPPAMTAGMRDPRLTAVGAEDSFNAGRSASGPTLDTFYQEMLAKLGGRGR